MSWYESEEFWRLGGPFFFKRDAWERAPAEVEGVVRYLGVEPGANVLDLCCGPGRHSLELARLGYRVTGVDRTAAYLEALRSRAGSEDLEIELIESDMREFERPGAFDGAINLFTSFGYFEDPEEDRRVVQRVYASLRPGARFAVDVLGKELLVRRFRWRGWDEQGESVLLQETEIDPGLGWVRNRVSYLTPGGRHDLEFEHRLYSGRELCDLLESCGFREVALYGGFDGSPYDLEAKRLVAVATK